MPLSVTVVRRGVRNSAELPSCLVPGARVLADLRRAGRLERVGAFHLDRRSGAFDVLSLFTFGVAFFLAGPHHGLQAFCQEYASPLRRLAQLAGLSKLPSAGALSRGLAAVDRTTADRLSDELLVNDPATLAVLAHPSVRHRDSKGDAWHVVDFDPSIRAFRSRELPEGDDLGPPTLRSPGLPGYSGQKRGETRIRHLPLLHAGSGTWLAYRLEVPGTPGLRSCQQLLQAARPWWPRLNATGKVLIRFDGEFGHTGGFRVCRDEGLYALGRLSRYALLERPEIRAAMATATWRAVVAPGAAKPTEAADLGWVTLHPAEGAEGAEGGPVEVRLILSRLRPTEGRVRHGVMIDGYQVEMFGTTLPADAWPADEVVVLYRARAVIENRFAQEDREFATERTFSYHLGGQMFMVSVALALWNHLICRDFVEKPPSASQPDQAARTEPEVASRPEPVVAPPEPVVAPPEPEIPPVAEPTLDAQQASEIPPIPSNSDLPAPGPEVPAGPLAPIVSTWFHDVATQPGWSLDAQAGTLACPSNTAFRLRYVDQAKKDHHRVIVGNPHGACNGCRLRAGCFGSTRTDTSKRIARSVPREVADQVKAMLASERLPVTPRPAPKPASAGPSDVPRPSLLRPHDPFTPGTYTPSFPSFLPARARKRARRALEGTAILRIGRRPPPPESHPLVEHDRATRQHQRKPRRRPDGRVHVVLRILAKSGRARTRWACE